MNTNINKHSNVSIKHSTKDPNLGTKTKVVVLTDA
jgi:hypothetical protein